jgi:RNA polymerase sigma factor (sigma-70 family)
MTENKNLAWLEDFIEQSAHLIQKTIIQKFPSIPQEEKDDIAQEVQLKIWKLLKSGREISNFRSYLKRVVFTTALDIFDKRIRMSGYPEKEMDMNISSILTAVEIPSPQTSLEKKELLSRVNKAIESLSNNRRIAMRLHLKGMRVGEIAKTLGWSESKANHLFYRALADLKKRLVPYGSRHVKGYQNK